MMVSYMEGKKKLSNKYSKIYIAQEKAGKRLKHILQKENFQMVKVTDFTQHQRDAR